MKLELLPVNAKKQQINPASCHLADKFPHFNPKPKKSTMQPKKYNVGNKRHCGLKVTQIRRALI